MNPTARNTESAAAGAGLSISNRRSWSIVGLLFGASMINYMDRATVSMALPSISSDLGLGPAAKGELLSSFFVSYALMQIPIGWCADRFNLKWLYAGMFLLWSLAQGLSLESLPARVSSAHSTSMSRKCDWPLASVYKLWMRMNAPSGGMHGL